MSSMQGFTQHQIQEFLSNDVAFVELGNRNRLALFESPTQSDFRVYAILVLNYEDGTYSMIEGANTEQGYIGGAICAERSALAKLRFEKKSFKIVKVLVVTDSENPLSPGALCREYLMSHAALDTVLLMGNANGDKISSCLLGELWPLPYQYRTLRRHQIIPYVESFVKHMETIDNLTLRYPEAVQVYAKAREASRPNMTNANIHPITFSAALLFDDGSIETSYQLNGIEYGCTLDAVSQLLREVERRSEFCQTCSYPPQSPTETTATNTILSPSVSNKIVRPVLLVMVDQYGVTHGPFAQARSLLSEHGYGYIKVLVHEPTNGFFVMSTIDEMIPQPKNGCQLLSCADFH